MRVRPEVVECYETTGTSDYLIKVLVPDMNAYHDFMHNVLFKLQGVAQVTTNVALREVKYETALPL
jgi:DNA-binding Lrp family transcriptional regulator